MYNQITTQAGPNRLIVTFKRNDGITCTSHYQNMQEAQERLNEMNLRDNKYGETWTIKE